MVMGLEEAASMATLSWPGCIATASDLVPGLKGPDLNLKDQI